MRIELITAESPESRALRNHRIIQFPQLTMPLIAALTPPGHEVYHVDEIVEPVNFDRPADLVGITAPTPSALHAYGIADEYRRRGAAVVIGGPHATALPEEAKQHADAVVIGEAEDTWPRVVEDFERGELKPFYRSSGRSSLAGLPRPRWDLIKRRYFVKGVTIATRGCPHRCHYCSIPNMYGPVRRQRPVEEVAAEVAAIPAKPVVFWDDNLGADPRYAKALFRAITPYRKWWTSQCTMEVAQDDEFLRLAARSGCQALFVGMDPFPSRALKGQGRPLTGWFDTGLQAMGNPEPDYLSLLTEKEEFLRHRGGRVAQQLLKLSEEEGRLVSRKKELEEAIRAGEEAEAGLQGVAEALKSARNWGTWDLLGGGLLATAVKHYHIDAAREAVHRVQQSLRRFQWELSDVQVPLGVEIDIDGLATFADYFFDGLIAEWVVQSRINNSLDYTQQQLVLVRETVAELRQELEQTGRVLADLREKKRETIETAGL